MVIIRERCNPVLLSEKKLSFILIVKYFKIFCEIKKWRFANFYVLFSHHLNTCMYNCRFMSSFTTYELPLCFSILKILVQNIWYFLRGWTVIFCHQRFLPHNQCMHWKLSIFQTYLLIKLWIILEQKSVDRFGEGCHLAQTVL